MIIHLLMMGLEMHSEYWLLLVQAEVALKMVMAVAAATAEATAAILDEIQTMGMYRRLTAVQHQHL